MTGRRGGTLAMTVAAAVGAAAIALAASSLTGSTGAGSAASRAAAPAAAVGSTQTITSLADAASQPQGLAAQDHTGSDPVRAAAPAVAGVSRDAAGHRLTIQGCLLDYGAGGACLPATPPAAADMGMDERSMPWTCRQVRQLIPHGVAVVGTDVLRLDTDHDGTACGPGDSD